MKAAVRFLVLAAILLLAFAAPASAQYMYLDSNGDGVHTAADRMNATGVATTVDVYLSSDVNRDGSTAECLYFGSPDGTPLTIGSYYTILQATGGTVTWGTPSDIVGFTIVATSASSETELGFGRGSTTAIDPGTYKLFTVDATGATGTPSLTIIDASAALPTGGNTTSFGSACVTDDFDNTMKLGIQWFDVDGLAAAASANANPTLVAPATANGTEGTLFSVSASASDPDAGQLVTLSQTNNAPFLTASSSNGPSATPSLTLTGTPNSTQSGSYTVNWTATDNFGTPGTTNASTAISIANLDGAPTVSAPATANGAEGSLLTVNVTASDPDGDAITSLTATGTAITAGATFTPGGGNTTGALSWTPGFTQAGNYAATFTASNALSGSATTNLTIADTDRPVALAPIATISVSVGSSSSTAVTASDPDGDTIDLTAALPAFAVLDAPTSGAGSVATTVTASPAAGAEAGSPYAASVTASANGSTDTENFQIIVSATDAPPVLASIGLQTVAEGADVDVPISASDPDGDAITFTANLPSFGALNAPTSGPSPLSSSFNLQPGFSAAGTYPSSVTATANGLTDSESFDIVVTNTDRGPTLDPITDVIVAEASSTTRAVHASDPDGDVVELTATGLPSFATLDAPQSGAGSVTTTVTIAPAIGDQGTYTPTITATAILATDSKSFTIEVTPTNQVVVLDPIAPVTIDEGNSTNVGVNASDADGQVITLSATLPTFAVLNPPTSGTGTVSSSVSINPGFSDAGAYPSSVTATDGIQPVTQNFLITVVNVDQAVTLDPIADVNVIEGSTESTNVHASDPDGETITLTAGLPAFATLDAPTSGAGAVSTTVTASPGFSDSGPYAASVTATAGPASATQNFQILVGGFDRAPSIGPIADLSVEEGSTGSTAVSVSDADGDEITLTANGFPGFATLDAPTTGFGSISTSVTASPAAGDAGTYNVSVTATSTTNSDTRTFAILVTRPNQPPTVSAPATESVNEGEQLTFAVTASDPDSDPLTLVTTGKPASASIQDNGNGNWTFDWTPGFSEAGVYNVTFTVNDGNGGSDAATTEITVQDMNRSPVADAGGPYVGVINVALTFNGTGSSDPDGDALTYAWTFGDGGSSNGATPSHAYATAGVYTVTLVVNDGALEDADQTTATISDSYQAAAFTVGGNNTTRLAAGKPTTCVQIEALNGSYQNGDVDLSTIKMISPGTGSVSEITALAGKTAADGDKNHNGVSEIAACFSKDDLRLLFSGLPAGTQIVTVEITGQLLTGGAFSASLDHAVKATGGALAASVSPNPLNPSGTLTFATTRPGRVRVTVFDLNGRLVNRLLDEVRSAGIQDVTWRGTNASGLKVASGVYYFRIETSEGRIVKAVTVLK